ncbi:hypothetical protein TSUD_389850 [Trifolium subterraneum]|uniref:F-box domain-containing protein n=1 Tax=Trifolium subterraneum TaxID=3900 RepID=A0A2Z6NHE9_TRISU|nr:hypothetical protein TSUD_389850 [Trifolium subterraneum]
MRRSKKSRAAASTVDMISSLPDAILCRILSFVTTKEAVATSILSKRWINLWHHVPNLNFPYINVDTVESNRLFNESVYSVLISREAAGSIVIDCFTLDIGYENPHLAYDLGFPNIIKWINLVVQRKLKHLCLRIDVRDYYDIDYTKLPVSIFTCTTLVSLDLCWFDVKGFNFTGFQFPSLKTLHLHSVFFSKVRDFMLFIAGCPILEDLEISEMYVPPLKEDSLTLQEFKRISFPKLTRAEFVEFRCHCFPVNALSTAKYLCIDTFKVLNIVKYLYTEDPRVYKVNQLQRPYDVVPIFHNLTHLELVNRWDLVVQVLHQCPRLQNLRLDEGLCDSMRYEEGHQENWVEPEFVPQCLLSSLITCTIKTYSLTFIIPRRDLLLEKYILKNARILQTMTILCKTKQPEMMRTLSMCPMASANVMLIHYTE